MIEKAKISGIMPALLTRSGMWVWPCWRYIRPPRMVERAYCTGMRRCASWKSTISAITASVITASRKMPPVIAAVPESVLRPTIPGSPATMPPKMISEMPLPMPCSEISSPSQTRNIVPAIIEMIVATVGSAFPPVSPMSPMPPNCWISSSWA